MGFFKDFKQDLSQAVNELLTEDESAHGETEDNSESTLNEMTEDINDSEESKESENTEDKSADDSSNESEEFSDDEIVNTLDKAESDQVNDIEELLSFISKDDNDITNNIDNNEVNSINETKEEPIQYNKEEEDKTMDDNVDLELLDALNEEESKEEVKENIVEKEVQVKPKNASVDDEVTVITKGTTINGSISTDGSLDIRGIINGDVECLGKLSITGKVKGNSNASEVYVNTDRLEGGITSEGSIKIGLGTVVIGDMVATSGVIAGAVKGEIDINGPIVIDSTAIIKGNIKAKSIQINNGAVIEGFCSLSYAPVDLDNIFE